MFEKSNYCEELHPLILKMNISFVLADKLTLCLKFCNLLIAHFFLYGIRDNNVAWIYVPPILPRIFSFFFSNFSARDILLLATTEIYSQ